jgi:hypothetical protein
VAAVADVIGIVTGVIGLIVGLVSLYLQMRSDARFKRRTAPARPSGPTRVRPEPVEELSGRLAALYLFLGSCNYSTAGSLVPDPARQIGSGIICVVGAVSLLLFVRSRGGAWTRSVAFFFGVVGGALMLASGLDLQNLPPRTTWSGGLIGSVLLAAITLLIVFIDRRRTRNAR